MIQESFEKIQDSPLVFPHIAQGVRFIRPRRFPYVVYYRVEGTRVVVFAVLHKAQSSSTWERRV
jgi:plasmid stabilization system protein ParE